MATLLRRRAVASQAASAASTASLASLASGSGAGAGAGSGSNSNSAGGGKPALMSRLMAVPGERSVCATGR
ncbi:hypothetical protein L204_102647 [Cryptococcus depauperatus]